MLLNQRHLARIGVPLMPTSNYVEPEPVQSIDAVRTTDASGEQYTYALEPELAGASIPRVARLTKGTITARCILRNLLLLLIVGAIYFGRRDYDIWTRLIQHGKPVLAHIGSGSEIETSDEGTRYLYRFRSDVGRIAFYGKETKADYSNAPKVLPIVYVPGTEGRIWQQGTVSPELRSVGTRTWLCGAFIGSAAWLLAIRLHEAQWRKQLRMVREGVAVHAVLRSGTVRANNNSKSCVLEYSYWTGDRMHTGSMVVTEELYRKRTKGNPYFTVLYDATRPALHVPYSQIKCAYLVAAKG